MLITAASFTGRHKIATDNFSAASLDLYIAKYQAEMLQDLLGITLFNLFKTATTDLTVAPPSGIYKDIYDAFAYDNSSSVQYVADCYCVAGSIVRSQGMQEMLKGFVYFFYTRDQPFKNTEDNDNSKLVAAHKSGMISRYNDAVESYKAIQHKISLDPANYPTFKGVAKDKIFF